MAEWDILRFSLPLSRVPERRSDHPCRFFRHHSPTLSNTLRASKVRLWHLSKSCWVLASYVVKKRPELTDHGIISTNIYLLGPLLHGGSEQSQQIDVRGSLSRLLSREKPKNTVKLATHTPQETQHCCWLCCTIHTITMRSHTKINKLA